MRQMRQVFEAGLEVHAGGMGVERYDLTRQLALRSADVDAVVGAAAELSEGFLETLPALGDNPADNRHVPDLTARTAYIQKATGITDEKWGYFEHLPYRIIGEHPTDGVRGDRDESRLRSLLLAGSGTLISAKVQTHWRTSGPVVPIEQAVPRRTEANAEHVDNDVHPHVLLMCGAINASRVARRELGLPKSRKPLYPLFGGVEQVKLTDRLALMANVPFHLGAMATATGQEDSYRSQIEAVFQK